MASTAGGRLEVVYIRGDRAIWHMWPAEPNGAWSTSVRLRGDAKSMCGVRGASGAPACEADIPSLVGIPAAR